MCCKQAYFILNDLDNIYFPPLVYNTVCKGYVTAERNRLTTIRSENLVAPI
jgi:hypothetical protein